MLYAILCYHSEAVVGGWSKEHDEAVMAKLQDVKAKLGPKMGPNARLLPTHAATTLNKNVEPAMVIDGPFAETKEQLLGFYVVDLDSLEDALEFARELGKVNPGGSYEIRPVAYFDPANTPQGTHA
ncbi:YciI family protein [Chelatococcus sambhunathii]|uniref:YciI family protein n=1 Tax=Chelatococcus sambhunathii TaxID=363953 RepID=A0ABU1DCC6_9HYPH|nr:YciI family protein [Chelatococcus sambhunathii]MDR4305754.1 YciI family protein [Chelatococcus sambhunathii]